MLLTEKLSGEKLVNSSNSPSPNQRLLPLTAKINDKNHLEIGGCDVVDLVKQYGSPLYILDEKNIAHLCHSISGCF